MPVKRVNASCCSSNIYSDRKHTICIVSLYAFGRMRSLPGEVLFSFACISLFVTVFVSKIIGNGYSHRHETFTIDRQWLWVHAIKFRSKLGKKSSNWRIELVIGPVGRVSDS